jgi:hypothetical protein
LAAAAVFAALQPARAQEAQQQTPPEQAGSQQAGSQQPVAAADTAEESVTVTAPAMDEMIRAFVGDVSAAGPQGQLARWDRTICPGVAGMRRQYAEALLDRIAVIAIGVGLDVGAPGCSPNALIFFTENSDALTHEIVERHGALVSRRGQTGNTRGREALQDFMNTPRPVRWWHVTRTMTSDGFLVRRGEQVDVRSMGRLRRATRQDFDRVIIVIDAHRIEGVRFGAVADYVAVAILAQLDPTADTQGYSTILNLFGEGEPRASAITDWDRAYLNGLYAATRDARDAHRQEREISRQMGAEVETVPEAHPEANPEANPAPQSTPAPH